MRPWSETYRGQRFVGSASEWEHWGVREQRRIGGRPRKTFSELQDPFYRDGAWLTSLCIREHGGPIRSWGTTRVPGFIAWLNASNADTNQCGRLLAEGRLT